uniref:Ribosome binding protein 1b n=1 Tax=Cyclopterus lumpus TaxID=8103 RepID=A0A8C2XDC9_CYCLU
MDISDPQTLGFMVFGGFMFLSAVGIALVSTLSMKETSYEEALAKQRRKLVQVPPQRAEKKKKDKTLEKKNKARKKEDRPDNKLSELGGDGGEEPEVAASPEPESEQEPATTPEPKPTPDPEPNVVAAAPVEWPLAPSPKERKKKKTAKVEPAAVVETAAQEVLLMAMAPVVNVGTEVTKEHSATKTEDPKETASKKKPKNKAEPVTDSFPMLPYGELLAAVSNTTLSHDQMHKLTEVLNQKAGVRHDSWQLASQKGDPLSSLKKQLEEKEKLLTSEQESAANAKSRLRELSKELGAEKSKTASLDARSKAELSAHVQKVDAIRATMETANQEHLRQTQQLNQKIGSLQEQLENGPNAQLARLQQENSILRDALNQATSQAESRQNAELARLRHDCVRLGRELTERTNNLQAVEERRKSLEAKMAAAEQELSQSQVRNTELEVGDLSTEVQSGFSALRLDFQASLQVLFPGISMETEQGNWLELFTQKVQESKSAAESAHSEVKTQNLSTRTNLNIIIRNILFNIICCFKNLFQLKEQMMLLEAQLEKQLEEASVSQSCTEESHVVAHMLYVTGHML